MNNTRGSRRSDRKTFARRTRLWVIDRESERLNELIVHGHDFSHHGLGLESAAEVALGSEVLCEPYSSPYGHAGVVYGVVRVCNAKPNGWQHIGIEVMQMPAEIRSAGWVERSLNTAA